MMAQVVSCTEPLGVFGNIDKSVVEAPRPDGAELMPVAITKKKLWDDKVAEVVIEEQNEKPCKDLERCRDWLEILDLAYCEASMYDKTRLLNNLDAHSLFYTATTLKTEDENGWAKLIFSEIAPTVTTLDKAPLMVKVCVPVDASKEAWVDDICSYEECGEKPATASCPEAKGLAKVAEAAHDARFGNHGADSTDSSSSSTSNDSQDDTGAQGNGDSQVGPSIAEESPRFRETSEMEDSRLKRANELFAKVREVAGKDYQGPNFTVREGSCFSNPKLD
eukprot:GILJ01020859.1.p1 GENE.GILJ01020859.1~~GILJ01020859.1.p1  ORF type:complete len:293 (-),score=53.44 GILJ01020859.1:78-911(-)